MRHCPKAERERRRAKLGAVYRHLYKAGYTISPRNGSLDSLHTIVPLTWCCVMYAEGSVISFYV
jgi:hypothetical protein